MQFDFTLNPNGAQQLDVRGNFFKLVGSTGKVRVTTDTGESIDLLPGQGVSNVNFQWLSVKDRTGSGNVGVLLAGGFAFTDDRITGSVEVIDGGRSRTLANQAFDGGSYAGAVAGQFPCVQLWNPVGSGKRVVVKRVTGSSGQTGGVGVKLTQTKLTTLDANTPSKYSGGTASTAELRNQNLAALPTERNLTGLGVQANVSVDRVYQEPIVLLPGFGLMLWSNALGNDCTGSFEFYEEAQ